jgi:hypothetical protein
MTKRDMKFIPMLCLAVLTVGLCLSGCAKKAESTSGDAVSAVQKAFAAASGELKENVGKAITAYQANDLVAAVVVIQAVNADTTLTPEQKKAADDLLGATYDKLGELVGKGDPKAIQMRDELRRLRR